ncbi:MAG: class I SAM-dependent methyltransferase [Candidatus Omnitrophota bacterium]
MDGFTPDIQIISKPNDFTFVEQWYELANEEHFWMIWRLKAFMNQVRSLKIPLNQPLHGIDVGCGRGLLREQIEQQTAWTVDGAEIDLDSLKRNSRSRGRLFFYNILEQNDRFRQSYDFLFLYDVLEHIENTHQFLRACCFMLKKNGLLFVNVPANQRLFSPYDTAMGHLRRYDKISLANEFDTDTFRLTDIRYWGFSLLPVLLARTLMLKNKKNGHNDIIRSGFRPPHPLVNEAFKSLMSVETALLKRPAHGTSVLAVFVKL